MRKKITMSADDLNAIIGLFIFLLFLSVSAYALTVLYLLETALVNNIPVIGWILFCSINGVVGSLIFGTVLVIKSLNIRE